MNRLYIYVIPGSILYLFINYTLNYIRLNGGKSNILNRLVIYTYFIV